jgi:hypothetical protein
MRFTRRTKFNFRPFNAIQFYPEYLNQLVLMRSVNARISREAYGTDLALTASLRTARFESSNAFASSRRTVAFCGCSTLYRTIFGNTARYLSAPTRTLCFPNMKRHHGRKVIADPPCLRPLGQRCSVA